MESKIIHIFIVLIIGLSASAQTDSNSAFDSRNYLAVEGGGYKVPIDSVTTLPQLVSKLATDWKLVMTGKAYYIGYTDDMFSIANHGNQAIPLLTHFIDTTNTAKAKIGALLVLHLIGINSTIAGRVFEEFKNKNAREALLKYLGDTSLHNNVLSLLMRDPWLTDIPTFMAYLELPERDYAKALSALRRYEINNPPLNQPISGSVFQKRVKYKTTGRYRSEQMHGLISFQKKLEKHLIIDNEITNSTKWANSVKELSIEKTSTQSISVIHYFYAGFGSFSDFSDLFDYSFDGKTVTVYGPLKAREIWLSWWKSIPKDEKERAFYNWEKKDE